MKKTILSILLIVVVTTVSVAQCDKNYILNGYKTEYLSPDGAVERSVDEKSLVTINKQEITIVHGPNEETMSGTIKYDSCSWKVPFKDGKAIIKTSLTGGNGQSMGVTLTIEGKDGKITMIAVPDDGSNRQIRVSIDKFEEKK